MALKMNSGSLSYIVILRNDTNQDLALPLKMTLSQAMAMAERLKAGEAQEKYSEYANGVALVKCFETGELMLIVSFEAK